MSNDPDLAQLEREIEASIMRDSFADFCEWAWERVTGAPLVRNRAITALIDALQAVADGTVTRLLIAIPPGTGKTTLLACYSAWRIARDPSWRSIHASHAFELSATESRRVRRLVDSDLFRRLFPAVLLRADENTIGAWRTTRDGAYYSVGVSGALTGRRAHEAVLDDPLDAADRYSKAARETLWNWFQESLSTRLDGDRAPIIVVQQRLDRDDLIGKLIAAGGWTLIELPAEDEQGELLAENVLPRAKLDVLKTQIGSATYACQYLQRPSDDSAATIKRSWWRFHRPPHVAENTPRPAGCSDAPAIATPDSFARVVISADLTFGSMKGDYACVQVWGAQGAGRYLLAQWRRRAGLLESVAAIKGFTTSYPGAKTIVEKAANGAGAVEELAAAGVVGVIGVRPLRSKAERIGLVSATIEGGSCMLPLGAPWLSDFVEELAGATKHDDAQDCAAYAIHELNRHALHAPLASVGPVVVAQAPSAPSWGEGDYNF